MTASFERLFLFSAGVLFSWLMWAPLLMLGAGHWGHALAWAFPFGIVTFAVLCLSITALYPLVPSHWSSRMALVVLGLLVPVLFG
ncbi:hypothetical protein FIV34_11700 [Luteibacter pinisoli]|uniref:Uncharacterized protein n=1 Tax=Luteibacter pinisoli TaxID=2589080 RepID=A0A4Y5Z612_9GAMM|nr:hypothetical protein [Luteibacter pinisoli]QDE39825.1 hypothetical protein FIV34_11700 [Luteibacter pinisoli]